jgi:hypothetical protein
MPLLPILPGDVKLSTLAVDRLGGFLNSCVNDENDVAAEEAAGGELPVDWGDGGGEDEVDNEE